jgi:hypothetical protein
MTKEVGDTEDRTKQLERIAREYEIIRDAAPKGSPLYKSSDRIVQRLRAKAHEHCGK